MLFNSFAFAVFFPIVTALYFVLPHRGRVPLLLASSCWFYMAFVPRYILILAVLILVDYVAGRLIERATGRHRTVVLVLSLCANVGMLAFFKYFNFINDNLAGLASALGWNYGIAGLSILLPIGLSFHTFQSMSYTIEVYRGAFPAERSLLHFATYVMFYPQLVAGPIERPQNLLHQFREVHRWDWARVASGAQLMASGFFKKIVIADRAAIIVNTVYTDPSRFSGAELLVGTAFFAVQIYCDFAGYSEIARGCARVMGFELMRNFDAPYLARDIATFWRRWHISLSTWFRDYLYVPLGGSRAGVARGCVNLAIVFLVSGLWHGANWTFVAWGALHAAYMVVYVLSAPIRRRAADTFTGATKVALDTMSWLLTLLLVGLAWVFFRASHVTDAVTILRRIVADFTPTGTWTLHPGLTDVQFGLALTCMAGLFAIEFAGRPTPVSTRIAAWPRWQRWGAYYAFALAFVVAIVLSPDTKPQPFIYFQF